MKKKLIAVFFLVIVVLSMASLTACKKTITCAACGETKTTKVHKFYGEEICDDCYNELKEAGAVK